MKRILAFAVLSASLAFVPVSQADHDVDYDDIVFEEIERLPIVDYFRDEEGHLRDNLPPGLAKQIERNGHLPRVCKNAAGPTTRKTSCLLPRTARNGVIVGDDIVLLDPVTGAIFDIIRGVLTE